MHCTKISLEFEGQGHQGQRGKSAESYPLTVHNTAWAIGRVQQAATDDTTAWLPGGNGLCQWENQHMLSSFKPYNCNAVTTIIKHHKQSVSFQHGDQQQQQHNTECRSQKKSSCMGSLWRMRPRSCMAFFFSSSLCCRNSCSSRCRSNISSIDTRIRGNFSSFSVSLHRCAQIQFTHNASSWSTQHYRCYLRYLISQHIFTNLLQIWPKKNLWKLPEQVFTCQWPDAYPLSNQITKALRCIYMWYFKVCCTCTKEHIRLL